MCSSSFARSSNSKLIQKDRAKQSTHRPREFGITQEEKDLDNGKQNNGGEEYTPLGPNFSNQK